MNERNGVSTAGPRPRQELPAAHRPAGIAVPAGYPMPEPEPDWLIRDRVFTDMATRYVRLTAWSVALLGAVLFCSVAASVAALEFGIVSLADGGQELFFPSQPAAPTDAPPDFAP